jgi:hypothetical protein
MIYEFTAGHNYWYIDTDQKYLKITDKTDETIIKETDQLGLLVQIEGNRIAAYESTYALIGVSTPIVDNHFFLEDGNAHIIWQEDPKVITLFFEGSNKAVRAYWDHNLNTPPQ